MTTFSGRSDEKRKAIVAGAGIGGLAAAICLAQRAWTVTVLERATEISEVGAGIQISPNGVRLLERMGVMPYLEDTLFEPEAIEIRLGGSGRQLIRMPLKTYAERRWGARYIHIHRADLIEGLRKRLFDLAPNAVQTGVGVSGYENTGRGAVAVLADGGKVAGDLLIGADGIHSIIRERMLGKDAPRFTGNVAWRTTVPMERLDGFVPPPTACVWAGEGRHAVTTRVRGGALVNFVGIVEQSDWQEESWSIEGSKADAVADFGAWDPIVTNLLEQADRLYRWALFDRAPLPTWHDGRVVLLGDAAHPMLPSLAQGAVQSIEDAWVLATQLDVGTDIEEACASYFERRIVRATKVQRGAADNTRLFHHRDYWSKLLAYTPFWLAGRFAPTLGHMRNDWVYAHDPDEERSR